MCLFTPQMQIALLASETCVLVSAMQRVDPGVSSPPWLLYPGCKQYLLFIIFLNVSSSWLLPGRYEALLIIYGHEYSAFSQRPEIVIAAVFFPVTSFFLHEEDYGKPERSELASQRCTQFKHLSSIPDVMVFYSSATLRYIISSVLLCCISL